MMRRTDMVSSLVVALLCQLSAGAVAAEKPGLVKVVHVSLPILSATVYEDRALVTRGGMFDVARGASRIVLDGLPAAVEEASVRASIEAGGGARVVSVSTRTEERAEAVNEAVRAAEKEVERIEHLIAQSQSTLGALERDSMTLGALEDIARTSAGEHVTTGEVDTMQLGKTLDYFLERRESIDSERRKVQQSIAQRQEELRNARANLDKVSARRASTVRLVNVDVESAEAGKASLSVSYIVHDAGWSPRYDARLAGGKLRVSYQGEVRQKTGEDWTRVQLALSTAHPALGAKRPDLPPVKMTTVVTGPVYKRVTSTIEGAQPVVPTEGVPEPVEAGEAAATVADSGTSVVFNVPDRADIPADGRAHKVTVTTFEDAAPRLAFETVPKLAKYVYLRCDSANLSDFPMLAGAVDVWRESGFIGTSSTKFVAPRGKLEVSFGIDENLKVKRVVDSERTKERAAGSRTEHRYAYDIEVANYRQDAIDVQVKENLPVSDVEEVAVQLDPSTTQTGDYDKEHGLLAWNLPLQPGEARRIHLEYTVTLPKDVRWTNVFGE
ncbi:MAG: mucoidy inhibitor MuiA family protein [Acidobacteriota bacterium]